MHAFRADGQNFTVAGRADHATDPRAVHAKIRSRTGGAIPIFINDGSVIPQRSFYVKVASSDPGRCHVQLMARRAYRAPLLPIRPPSPGDGDHRPNAGANDLSADVATAFIGESTHSVLGGHSLSRCRD